MEWFFGTTLGKTWHTTIGGIHLARSTIRPSCEQSLQSEGRETRRSLTMAGVLCCENRLTCRRQQGAGSMSCFAWDNFSFVSRFSYMLEAAARSFVTVAGVRLRALAAANPPNPPPTITIRGIAYPVWRYGLRQLHGKDDAEFGFPAHHAGVALRCFLERVDFDHGTHAGQFGELQRILGVGWCSRSPALYGAAP